MKLKGLLFMTALLLNTCEIVAAQNGQEFVDQDGKFKLILVSDWRAVSYSDAVGRQKTEFINKDRSEGLLKVTQEKLTGTVGEAAQRDEENFRIYHTGFENASTEAFGGGALNGVRISFYYTESGRKLASTNYFLQDGNSVWVLRFTGRRGSLDLLRNQTHQIVRSFPPL